MILSTRTKEAVKTALAMTIAYGLALQAGWDNPKWAGFAVAMISLATIGQSLNKGLLRMAGTVLAAVVALTLIALFAQQRWLFILFVSLWFGLCTYMNTGPRNQYFWFCAAFVSLIICMEGGPNPEQAFNIAMLRLQETGLGIVVYSLVSVLLWPNNSLAGFQGSALALCDSQRKLFAASLEQLTQGVDGQQTKTLRGEEIAGLNRMSVLLDAALSDSDEIREMRSQWLDYCTAAGELAESMQQWRESFGELQGLPLDQLLPGLDAFAVEIDSRLGAVQQMLQYADGEFTSGPVPLPLDLPELEQLSHFNRAALLSAHHHLLDIDAHSRALVDILASIRGFSSTEYKAPIEAVSSSHFIPDPDRLLAAGKMMLILWLAFIAVVYIWDFPGGLGFLSMCGPIGLTLVSNPQLPVRSLFSPVAFSILFAGLLYIFVMPQLSSFLGLGLLIFLVTFVICYHFASPQQMLGRAFGLALFVVLIAVSNEQTYSFLSVANTALMFSLLLFLLAIVSCLPFSPLPERVLLRLMKRYFLSAHFLLALGPASTEVGSIGRKKRYHRRQLATLPGNLQSWGGHADPLVLGSASAQQIPAMLSALQALSYRMEALLLARELPQSPFLVTALQPDMLAWREQLLQTLDEFADSPQHCVSFNRAALQRRQARLEHHIEALLNEVDCSPSENENMYVLLGAYRGTSEAVLDFADAAATIDWEPWYKERFA